MTDPKQITQAILFADIAQSTRLYDELGDTLARGLVAECLSILSHITKLKRGTVVKTIGDEIMSIFKSANHAAAAALLMQEDISASENLKVYNVQLRIGFHFGPVIEDKGDVYGDAVNVAARMVEQAKAGQIITTRETIELLGKRQQGTSRIVDKTHIKGKRSPVDIFELSWGQPEEMTMITNLTDSMAQPAKGASVALTLQFQGIRFAVNQQNPVLNMGRDATNSIVLKDPKVSRLHARIELRKDKFILVDQSTNGTYLCREDGQMELLRRDEIALPDRGLLGLGQEVSLDDPVAIKFESI